MSHCPNCQNPIKEDFGLITCIGCGSMLLVELDGSVGIYEEAQESQTEEEDWEAQNPQEEALEEWSDPEPKKESWPEETPEAPNEWSQTEAMEPQVEVPPPIQTSSDLSEISAYGNSDISGASDGMLRFNICIGGIDNPEISSFIRDVLLDEKLMWEVDELMAKIQEGTLELKGVSPVKASIVVSRLKTLPLEIRWEQYAIHQAELTKDGIL